MTDQIEILVAGVVLAGVHLLAGRVRLLQAIPRRKWLSLAGGISVGYVFAHLIPEVAEDADQVIGAAENGAWLLVLAGLAVFYSLEHIALSSRRRRATTGEAEVETPASVFWISVASFSMYNLAIGYLLREQTGEGVGSLLSYTFALGVHFVVNDIGLREHHKQRYHDIGRWVLAASIVAGAVAGLLVDLSQSISAGIVAVLAGAIVLNVMKEELPEERRASLTAFLSGLIGYAALVTLST